MEKLLFVAAASFVAVPAAAQQPPHETIGAQAAVTAAAPIDAKLAERLRITRQANRWEAAYLAFNAVDVIQTCDILSRGVAKETNPIVGKNPSCGKLIAYKGAMSGVQYLLYRQILRRSPKAARLTAQLSTGLQGAVVGLNLRYTFKGR